MGNMSKIDSSDEGIEDKEKDCRRYELHHVKLERVLGLTVSCNAALSVNPKSGILAYPAGCTVVLYNPKKNKQSHILNFSRKTITSVAFSPDGNYIVTGECGHLPCVRVWDVREKNQHVEFLGHKYGINCVAFSPNNKYVVSVGSQHDMIVNVWDWKNGIKIASNKVSSKVKALSFSENGSYFVTVGNRHVKYWYLDVSRPSKYKEAVPLMGRSGILGEQRNNYFCDVGCGRGDMGDSTYTITKSGLLCEFNSRRLLDRWVELRTNSANCLSVGESFILIGCADGIVRCFSPYTLQFITTLPRTHYLGVDVCRGLTISHMAGHPANCQYPDTVAVVYDPQHGKVTCIYNDHSMYIWDVHDIKKVGKSHSFLYHSACIWGVELYPSVGESSKPVLPPGSFITCSSDDTVRIWNIDPNMETNTVYKRNIYSNELLKTLYIDPTLQHLRDVDYNPSGSNDKTDMTYDSRNGIRCIKVSGDGKHLASGDRCGNIRVHELQFMDEVCKIEAHDAEVLCLEYTGYQSPHNLKFLASASRDRLIHVFDVNNSYAFHQTLDDHSSSITAVNFLNVGDQLQMVSCGADKSIIFREAQDVGCDQYMFNRTHHVVGKTTLYDMEVDASQRHILTACQDRSVRVYNVNNGKYSKSFKGSLTEDGTLIKLVMDGSSSYVATSCTDKTLYIYDYYSGECMASMFGHSELVTGLTFMKDNKHFISVSGDGCIFVWKLPPEMTQAMLIKLKQVAARAEKRSLGIVPRPLSQNSLNDSYDVDVAYDRNANEVDDPNYNFSVGQLPLWAKKQMSSALSPSSPPSSMDRQVDFPKGRWAQRIDSCGITVKSVYDSDSIIRFPASQLENRKLAESSSSKDSSLDSSHYDDRREMGIKTESAKMGLSDVPSLRKFRQVTDDSGVSSLRMDEGETEHEGDVEDYSEPEDTESTEPDHYDNLMYYPQNEDLDIASKFTVNATNQDELRRSQRRYKKIKPSRPGDLPIVSITGSQDSDDDDEVSTPSADTAEKNIMSLMSVSMESLERLGEREKFMRSNFESLEGMKSVPVDTNKNSLSAKFLTKYAYPSGKNASVISATVQNRLELDSRNNKEILRRQIEETKRKLQNIAVQSDIKYSQSISDLSSVPNQVLSSPGSNKVSPMSGSLRRACSLSDLSKPPTPRRLLPSPPINVSGKIKSQQSVNLAQQKPSKWSSRSSSVMNLNQSDSETDHPHTLQKSSSVSAIVKGSPLPNAMKPTISSLNKVSHTNTRRKLQAMSTGDLRVKLHGEDSSSEDTSPAESNSKLERGRSGIPDRYLVSKPNGSRRSMNNRATSERDLSRIARDVTERLTSSPVSRYKSDTYKRMGSSVKKSLFYDKRERSPEEIIPVRDTEALIDYRDIASTPLSRQLCEHMSQNLKYSAESISQLYDRVTMDTGLSESARQEMLSVLNSSAVQTHQVIRPMLPDDMNMAAFGSLGNKVDLSGENKFIHIMQQYSDILVDKMQRQFNTPQSNDKLGMESGGPR